MIEEEEKPEDNHFEFQIGNKSQYTLNHVYSHSPHQNYKESDPLIENWLESDSHISINLTEGDYLVNATGPLLAYTTEAPMYLYEPKKMIILMITSG